jgi:hypothetical protein
MSLNARRLILTGSGSLSTHPCVCEYVRVCTHGANACLTFRRQRKENIDDVMKDSIDARH